MESLYILLPLSVLLVLALIVVMGWAVYSGQFDELDLEGLRVLEDTNDYATTNTQLDVNQGR